MSEPTEDTKEIVAPVERNVFVDACGRCNVDLVGVVEVCPNCGAINRREKNE